MQKELISISLAAYRRITLKRDIADRADAQGVSRSDLPLPLTCDEGEQPTFNDIATAAMALNCRVEIEAIRLIPKENDLHD